MDKRFITLVVLICITFGLIGYDFYAEFVWGDDYTISKLMLWINQHCHVFSLVFSFWLGISVGHFFLYQTIKSES